MSLFSFSEWMLTRWPLSLRQLELASLQSVTRSSLSPCISRIFKGQAIYGSSDISIVIFGSDMLAKIDAAKISISSSDFRLIWDDLFNIRLMGSRF